MTANLRALPEGTQILWYRIKRVLGQGGFGITYLADDTNLQQQVALKEYLPSAFAVRGPDSAVVAASADVAGEFQWGLERFVEEGRTLAKFDHPGIVRVQSVFEHSGTAYLVMRYEDGETLSDLLKREPRLPEERVVALLDDVMDGLSQVHEAGFIHRDIKPGNLFLRERGGALLIDFGAARQSLGEHSQSLTAIVSPGYAPFEQYFSDGARQGPWTDIYALGATAYRAVSGVAPMPAVDRSRALLSGQSDTLVHLESLDDVTVSANFLAAVNAAMQFQPEARPQSVQDWREIFQHGVDAVAAEPSEAPTMMAEAETILAAADAEPKKAWYKKKRHVILLIVFALFALFALFVLFVLFGRDEPGRNQGPAVGTDVSIADDTQRDALRDGGDLDRLDAAVEARPATDISAEIPENRIARLLDEAGNDIAEQRLTRPPGNNAVEKYTAVLALDPDNQSAREGIDLVARRYLEMAREAVEGGDTQRAIELINRAASAIPDHGGVARAAKQIKAFDRLSATVEQLAPRVARSKDRQLRQTFDAAVQALKNGEVEKARKLLRNAAKRAGAKARI